MEAIVARKTWRTLEPIHGAIYFSPDATAVYAGLGLGEGRMGYFASRSAAMGPVPAEVVIATFFNFCPDLVRSVIPEAWNRASPEKVLAARLQAADTMLRTVLGGNVAGAEMAEAATLARRAAEAACLRPEGRPLFAGHAGLGWPDEDHLVLWHAQTLLREFRGDGHVALLLAEGLDGCEALVVHAATGDVPAGVLRATRAWAEDAWAAAVDRVRSRGWLESGDELLLTATGRAHRQRVEDSTDALALSAYVPLGEDGCTRLRQLARPFSQAIADAGILNLARAIDAE
jgi:hypothetical protein